MRLCTQVTCNVIGADSQDEAQHSVNTDRVVVPLASNSTVGPDIPSVTIRQEPSSPVKVSLKSLI